MLKFRPALALIGLAAMVATACGGGNKPSTPGSGDLAGTSITFSVSLAEEEKDGVQKVIDAFQQSSGAKVTLTSVTSADLPEKLKVEVESNRHTVDLFAQDNLALRVLVDRGLVEDLTDVKLPDGILESMVPERFGGKQYFLPFRPNVRITYANKDRFDKAKVKPPTTADALFEAGSKLKSEAGGQGKITLSLAEGDPAAVTVSEWIVSYGGKPVLLNDQGSVAAFTALQKGWKDGIFAKESLLAKYDTEVDYLRGETSWLATNWPFTSSSLAKEGLLDRFEVYRGWKGPDREAHVIGGDVLGIPKGVAGKQKEAAIALAKYLMSREAQEALVTDNAWPSIRDDAYAQVPSEQKDTFDAVKQALENGWYRPNVAYWSDVSEAMNAAVRRILDKGEDVKTVLDDERAKIEAAAKAKGAEYPPR